MNEYQRIFGTNAEQMCTYLRTFAQSEFVIARFLEALRTILTKNRGLTREWLLVRARLWRSRVPHRIFLENRLLPRKFWKWRKIPSEWTTNTLVPACYVTYGHRWKCVPSCNEGMVFIRTNTFAKCILGLRNLFFIRFPLHFQPYYKETLGKTLNTFFSKTGFP